MANQRKKNKRIVGAWVDEKLHAKIKEFADRHSIPMSKALEMIITHELKKGSNDDRKG
jgi:hypothetical protein